MGNDCLIEEFLQDPHYILASDWNVYTNRPPSGPIGKKEYPWRNIVRVNHDGYLIFTYKGKYLKLHRVIFRYYYGFIDNREINHKDGNKGNNIPLNLELATRQENMNHAKINGLVAKGEEKPNSVLCENDVIQIKELLENGLQVCQISKQLGISRHLISRVKNNKHWMHIKISQV